MVMHCLLLLMGVVLTSANTKNFQVIMQEERNLDVPLPIPESKASITFTDPSGTEHSLYENGRGIMQALSLYEGRFSLQNKATGSHLRIRDLKPSDAGTYEVRDSNGRLMVSAVVESRDITGCSEQINVFHGKELKIFFPGHAKVLEFSPSFEPFQTKVVWRRRYAGSAQWSVSSATSDHTGNYTARSDSGLVLQRTCVTVWGGKILKYTYVAIAGIALVFVASCWCVCKCCPDKCCKKKRPRNQRPAIYSAPEPENLYRPPVAGSPVTGGFSQVPGTQAENTSEYHLPPHLSPQPDAGACFQPTRRNGDSLDFLFTSPLTTDRIPDSVYNSEKLNFL